MTLNTLIKVIALVPTEDEIDENIKVDLLSNVLKVEDTKRNLIKNEPSLIGYLYDGFDNVDKYLDYRKPKIELTEKALSLGFSLAGCYENFVTKIFDTIFSKLNF